MDQKGGGVLSIPFLPVDAGWVVSTLVPRRLASVSRHPPIHRSFPTLIVILELAAMIGQFMENVLATRPDDVLSHAADFFVDPQLRDKVLNAT